AGDEVIAPDRNAAAEGFLEHVGDGDALPRTGIEVLDKRHVDIASKQCELHRTQFIEGPSFSATARGNGLAPDCGDLFAQRLFLDLPDAGKELRDFSDAVDGRFV